MSVTCYDKVLVYKRERIFSVSVHHYNHHCLSLALDLLLPRSRQMSLSVACYQYRTSLINVVARILDHEDKSTCVLRNFRSHLTECHNSEESSQTPQWGPQISQNSQQHTTFSGHISLYLKTFSVWSVSESCGLKKHNKLGIVGRANYFLRVRVTTTNNLVRGFVTKTG
jgi:hypothetical protein